jgi:hypothetical protein
MAEKRRPRRATRAGAAGADPTPQQLPNPPELPTRATEDTDQAWGDRTESNDENLKRDVPPHW